MECTGENNSEAYKALDLNGNPEGEWVANQSSSLAAGYNISLLFFLFSFSFHILNCLFQFAFLTQGISLKLAKSKLPGRQKRPVRFRQTLPYEARSPEVLLYVMSFIHKAAIPCRVPSEREQLSSLKPEELPPVSTHCQLPHGCCFLTVTQNTTFQIFSFGSISIQRAIAVLQATIWCRDLSKLEMRKPKYESLPRHGHMMLSTG